MSDEDVEHFYQLLVLKVVDGCVNALNLRVGLPNEIFDAEELADPFVIVRAYVWLEYDFAALAFLVRAHERVELVLLGSLENVASGQVRG